MKMKIIGLFVFFLLLGLFGLSLRSQVKQVLPREGEVKIVGSVYTPYLLLDSALYFLKEWDESLELTSTKNFREKARFELIFANKRLLEMEKLARKGNFSFVPRLLKSFSNSLDRAISFAKEAERKGEDIEGLVWLFQESVQDQQEIFKKIEEEAPQDSYFEIQVTKNESGQKIGSFLREIYKLE